jgi:16S rRNA (cytosine1402-N4)-methyltransferase
MNEIHIPVLKNEVVKFLINNPNGIYLDCTSGSGGHSLALLQNYPNIFLISSDWDLNAIKRTTERLKEYKDRSKIISGRFSDIEKIIKKAGFDKVDGILADFGTSKNQILEEDGFSFKKDTFLDMRMSKCFFKKTAADILKKASENELAYIIYTFGQEPFSRKISRAIISERTKNKIETTLQLANLIENIIPRKGKIHPATKTFQALRIVVNEEFDEIKKLLNSSLNVLNDCGRMALISFHSLEDRIVKEFYQSNKNMLDIIGPKIIGPTAGEISENPSSRSSKMRIFQKMLTK